VSWLLALLLLAVDPPGYDELLATALQQAKAGELAPARLSLDRAILIAPGRPEAWTERCGLAFLESHYERAVADCRSSLRLQDDAYARDLLASSLSLLGRPEEAVSEWNRLGQPRLHTLELRGLAKTPDRLARRELAFREGSLLEARQLRLSRARLQESGLFQRITLRPLPKGDGSADLEVALQERHGLPGWRELLASTAADLAFRRARLRYVDLFGTGLSAGVFTRFDSAHPGGTLSLDWPRPVGLPVYLHLEGGRGRADYETDGKRTRINTRGLELGLTSVVGPDTVLSGGVRWQARTENGVTGDQDTIDLGVEQRLLEAHRQRLDAGGLLTATLPRTSPAWQRLRVGLRYRRYLAAPDDGPLQGSLLAAQVQVGQSWGAPPIEALFAPAAGPDAELPLRAHPLVRDDLLGSSPRGPSLVLGNLEWRQRLIDGRAFQLGVAAFADAARVASSTWVDVGAGLRIGVKPGTVLRLDFAHGLADGSNAVSGGLGQSF
jgi:hypothetical protein